jgi:hypothetical protein
MLFRALFPSWRFFEEAVDPPRLEVRVRSGGGANEWGEWRSCIGPAVRGWGNLILNPTGNRTHALHSLVEQAVSDLAETDESQAERFAESVSYRLLCRLARASVNSSDEVARFQFRVLAPDEVLLSMEHEI